MFGDSVSEAAWPHVWLSEGFATYSAALYMEHRDGPDELRQTMARARDKVAAYAIRAPQERIFDRDLEGVSKLLTANTYDKGAWVLHMLRTEVGDETFWQVLSTFYSRFRDRNAGTDDFVAVVEQVSEKELAWFFEQWLERPGMPELSGQFETLESGGARVEIWQEPLGKPQGAEAPFRFTLELEMFDNAGDSLGVETVEIAESRETFALSADRPAVRVVLDPATRLLAGGLAGQDVPARAPR